MCTLVIVKRRFVLLQISTFITLELALVTLEWAFAAVGKLDWLVSYSEYSKLALVTFEWAFAAVNFSIRIVDIRKVGQGHEVQFSE